MKFRFDIDEIWYIDLVLIFFELPISTWQIESLSDPSCFTTDNTLPKTTPFTFSEQSSNDSTSNPPIDNFSERCKA